MPDRPPKAKRLPRTRLSSQPVDQGIPIEQPPGEDFSWPGSESTPQRTLAGGGDIVGPWDVVSRTVSRFLVYHPRSRQAHVTIFQGDEARRQLAIALREEARYQALRRVQPNN